jgi:hypothetical protein
MKTAKQISKSIARLFLVLAAVAALLFIGSASKANAQTTTESGFTYNGIIYTSWWYNEYGNDAEPPVATGAATTSMNQLVAEGGNYVSVLVTQYVQTGTSTTIAPSATQTPLDDQLVFAIQGYHNMGMKVFLKPHVDSLDGTWRGAFEPTDPAAWFASFQTFIVHYATLAQANNVEGLVIGTEYKTLSGSAYESNWATIIAAVRAVYTGQIAYAANAVSTGDEFTTVSFWPLVDIIGLDAYVPLTDLLDPTVAQLVAAWSDTSSPYSTGFNAVAAYQLLNTTYGKPVIMTEIGYDSVAGSNIEPYANYSTTYDGTEQEDCYEAVFEVFSKQTSWFKGIFFWNWTISPLAADDLSDDPNGKPAGTVTLPKWFASSLPGIKLTNSNASITMAQTSTATSTITVGYTAGYSGSVTLAVSGLPAGVTASFATNPTTTTSVLTLTASATAAAGTAKVTITGTSGSYTSTTTISLTILTSACNIVYTIANNSSTGFGVGLTIDNTGTNPLTSWTLTWSFANGQTITSIYGDGTETQSGANVTVTNASYNGALAALTGSTSAGFQGAWNGVTNAIPTNLALNGTACSVNGVAPGGGSGSFTLAPSASTLSLAQGKTATDTISVTDVGGFTGSVTLAATGLPSGVTVAYGTNPTTATSVLTFTASATATAGTSTVTITGTSGTTTATTTISLTVSAAGFTLAPSASTLAVTQGKTATDTITVTDVGGFTGSVTLAATGLPTGVTVAYGTNPTTATSVLTFTASATATTGAATVTITGTSGTTTATTTINLTVSAAGFTLAPSASTLAVTQGKTATDTITVTDVGGFTGSVTLAATGLPTGVTVAYGTNPTTATSVLTFTASATATAGTSTVTITGTSGTTTATTTISLTVSAAGFTLAPSASTLAIAQGKTATDTITVTDTGGFTGSVTLAATGLPTGVTVAYGTNPTTATSVLTFTASATATAGTSTVTITGTSGTTTATTTISLTVSAAGFTLAPSAATLSVTQGKTATDTITVTDVGGFTGSVTLAATGLPTGVTVAYGTNPTTATSVLTFTASATATVGTSTVTITGTSGTTTATTTIALTVASSTPSTCTVDYAISPQNSSAFGAAITIVNGSTAITSWTLTWTFANGQTISSLWNGIETQSGTAVTVKNEPYNGSIAAGGTLTGIGFNGTWNGTTNAIPTAISLNGTACTVN